MSKNNKFALNQEIEAFVQGRVRTGGHFTAEELSYLNQYIGYGGMWNEGDRNLPKERGLYEYYTPIPIVEKMVGLCVKHGYITGKVLEPSCGTGRFLHYFSPQAEVVGLEPDLTSCSIAKANFPTFDIRNQTFNELFTDRRGNAVSFRADYSLIIGNPPYGDFAGKFTSTEKQITKATTYPEYFISRGLDLLLPGGLLCYIIPSSFLEGQENPVKTAILQKGELVDAYRLPVNVFEQTSIQTDIIIFKRT